MNVKYIKKTKSKLPTYKLSLTKKELKPSAEERRMQTEFFKFIDNEYPTLRHMCYAVPNGGRRSAQYGKLLKLQGLTSGVPDICCAIPAFICKDSKPQCFSNGLYIEFKSKGKKTNTSQEQKKFIKHANLFNYCAHVVDSLDEAKSIFKAHVNEFTKDLLTRLIDGVY